MNEPVSVEEYRNELFGRLEQFTVQAVGNKFLICHVTKVGVECKTESSLMNLMEIVEFASRHVMECQRESE